jgi:3-isopropylmalate dehydrogenase
VEGKILVLPGDGIGPEVVAEAVKVLEAVGHEYGHRFELTYAEIGGIPIDKYGVALPEETLRLSRRSDAILLGAVGGPRWADPRAKVQPEDGLLALRKKLGLFANLRPVKVFSELVDSSTLKPEVVQGVDLIVLRELTGGAYYGKPKKQWQTPTGRKAVDSMLYSEMEIERILRVGFELARMRRKKLASVDKANVLQSSRLWRQIANELAPQYPDVELTHVLADACAMRLVLSPRDFDVIVAENTFGDILSDEASMLAGSMGMLPSASLSMIPKSGSRTFGLYEPVHGSDPERAGKNVDNPIATILSAAMMLQYSLALYREAEAIERAVEGVLKAGYRTWDIMSPGKTQVGTREMGDLIAQRIA